MKIQAMSHDFDECPSKIRECALAQTHTRYGLAMQNTVHMQLSRTKANVKKTGWDWSFKFRATAWAKPPEDHHPIVVGWAIKKKCATTNQICWFNRKNWPHLPVDGSSDLTHTIRITHGSASSSKERSSSGNPMTGKQPKAAESKFLVVQLLHCGWVTECASFVVYIISNPLKSQFSRDLNPLNQLFPGDSFQLFQSLTPPGLLDAHASDLTRDFLQTARDVAHDAQDLLEFFQFIGEIAMKYSGYLGYGKYYGYLETIIYIYIWLWLYIMGK